jgi:hypothetical protein
VTNLRFSPPALKWRDGYFIMPSDRQAKGLHHTSRGHRPRNPGAPGSSRPVGALQLFNIFYARQNAFAKIREIRGKKFCAFALKSLFCRMNPSWKNRKPLPINHKRTSLASFWRKIEPIFPANPAKPARGSPALRDGSRLVKARHVLRGKSSQVQPPERKKIYFFWLTTSFSRYR